ncbi:hypothetical protein [Nocardia paucivorans]|uniref:hypothetical protein n=1 Tax=Nocardia paucivorans TaxID=114259 RepID=UPI0012F85091|nr:hypothetical protein [Nocardia paucivorans]
MRIGWDDHMAIAENAAAIMTGVNARVHITVEVGRAAPIDDSHAFDTVFEFGLRVDSGRLTVTSPMSWPGEQVPVPEDGCVSGRPCRHRLAITTTPHRTTRKVGDVSDSSAGRVIAPTPA